MKHFLVAAGAFSIGLMPSGCSGDDDDGGGGGAVAVDPDQAASPAIDRFSDDAGTLMVRDDMNGLPAADEPIDFDQGPFVTQGFGPAGEVVRYYNFDIQPTAPAPIYTFVRASSGEPVADQLNIVGVIPGDAAYNDFWQVNQVSVPDDYVANSITSVEEVLDSGYDVEEMDALVNCPIVPDGSTASERLEGGDAGLIRGWYGGMVVRYFTFAEKPDLAVTGGGVPTAPIFVAFNVNPGDEGGGPASGFVTEGGSAQTHNVIATLPSDPLYSPLWRVKVYDNAAFDGVSDLESATAATLLADGAGNVNCPVVAIE